MTELAKKGENWAESGGARNMSDKGVFGASWDGMAVARLAWLGIVSGSMRAGWILEGGGLMDVARLCSWGGISFSTLGDAAPLKRVASWRRAISWAAPKG